MEDTVEFHIYRDSAESNNNTDSSEFLKQCNDFLQPLVRDYIWQHDALNLQITTEGLPHISGRCRFGDNIDDEWFIVMLLIRLSCKFTDIGVRVSDEDGEVLLIEAAHALPKWLKPDTASNRVWIRRGSLYIIPMPTTPATLGVLPTAIHSPQQAMAILQNEEHLKQAHGIDLQAKGAMSIIASRVNKLQETLSLQQHHNVRLLLPACAASTLQSFPFIVAHAVTAFYYRDFDDMKACSNKSKESSPNTIINSEFVETRVRFTRCLYAQLYHQQFDPEPFFPSLKVPAASHPNHNSIMLGMKLAVGMQILYNQLKFEDENLNLKTSQAKHDKSNFPWRSEFVDFIETKSQVPTFWPPVTQQDDDDGWMVVEPQYIDQLLADHMQSQNLNESTSNSQTTVDDIANSINQFVLKTSGFEGAEFKETHDSDSDFDLEDSNTESESEEESENESGKIQFKSNDFINLLQQFVIKESNTKEMDSIMTAMDNELAETNIRKTFIDIEEKKTNTDELDLDFNVVKNLLESVSQEYGIAGPASTLLTKIYK